MTVIPAVIQLVDVFVGYLHYLFRADYPLATLLAFQTVLFGVLLAGYLVSRKKRFGESSVSAQVVFHFFNLVPITLAVMLLDNNFERIIGAHLLLSLLVAVKLGPRWIVGVTLAVSLLGGPTFLRVYHQRWKSNYTYEKTVLLSSQEELARLIDYVPDSENPWCNTILISLGEYDDRVLAIPAGIGVSYVYSETGPIDWKPRSRYILGDDLIARLGRDDFQLLSASPIGNLYLNPETDCPGK